MLSPRWRWHSLTIDELFTSTLQQMHQTKHHWKMFLKFLNNSLPSYSSEQWQNIKHSMFNKATNHCWLTLLHQHHLVAAKTDAPKCALCSISCTLKNVKWLPDPVVFISDSPSSELRMCCTELISFDAQHLSWAFCAPSARGMFHADYFAVDALDMIKIASLGCASLRYI